MLINAYKGFDIKKENGQYVIYKIALSDFAAPFSDFIMGFEKTLEDAKQKATIYVKAWYNFIFNKGGING